MAVVGLVLPFGTLIAFWYLPVPRTWWFLIIFVITYWIPGVTVYVGLRRLRRLKSQFKAERTAQRI